jgi:hypothetical protein
VSLCLGQGRGLLRSLVALGLLAAPACSSSKEYCQELCACQGGCTDAQLDTCVEDLNDAYSDAASDGCRAEADDYLSCLATETECVGPGAFDASRCDDEAQAIASCRRITVGSGGNGGAGAGDAGGIGGTGNVVGSGATGATGAGAAGGAGGA